MWFYFGSTPSIIKPDNTMTVEKLAKEPLEENIIESLSSLHSPHNNTAESVSYHLVGKGINVPHNLPDVFLDMDGFD
jgi:hypothetical protein